MPVTEATPSQSAAVSVLSLRTPRLGLFAGIIAGLGVAALAWLPDINAASLPPGNGAPVSVGALINFGVAGALGIFAAWVGWSLESWGRRVALLAIAIFLAGTQSVLLAGRYGIGWEPFSTAAALTAGLMTAACLTPPGVGVERWFQGRLGQVLLDRLSNAQSAEFLLPDQREAAVLTCRMLNETALREQMPAREFLKLMEAFRLSASRVLLDHGALLDAPESGAVRAFFGLPMAVENHAERAAVAALALASAMKEFAAAQAHKDRDSVECGTGITCGTITAGVTGSSYTAAGDAVEQSRWLAGLNSEYQTTILTDYSTHRLAESIEDRPLEILNPPEGAAVEVFHLLATRGGLSQEAMARRDAFHDAMMLLRAGHAEDALRRFEDAREGLVHEDAALERFVSQAAHQAARDQRKLPPPARPRARLSPRRILRP